MKAIVLTVIFIVVIIIEVIYSPRVDITPDGDIYLWYGPRDKRKCFIIH